MNGAEDTPEALTALIEQEPTADLYFRRGRAWWARGEKGRAITDYEHAIALDPESPAAVALEMARGVMDFYHTDLYNP